MSRPDWLVDLSTNRTEDVFTGQPDFAQMIKLYADCGQHDAAGRYSPSTMIKVITKKRDGLLWGGKTLSLRRIKELAGRLHPCLSLKLSRACAVGAPRSRPLASLLAPAKAMRSRS